MLKTTERSYLDIKNHGAINLDVRNCCTPLFPIFPLCARFSPTLARRFNRRKRRANHCLNGSIDSRPKIQPTPRRSVFIVRARSSSARTQQLQNRQYQSKIRKKRSLREFIRIESETRQIVFVTNIG